MSKEEDAKEEEQVVGKEEIGESSTDAAQAKKTCSSRLFGFVEANKFMFKVLIAIGLAFAAPGVGLALAPRITASYIAVCIIFVLTGLNLKTSELVSALKNVKFNAVVQLYNLGVVPIGAWLIANTLQAVNALDKDLKNGVIVCAALPMTVNMVIVLTKTANGDEAAAVFNAAFGNFLGVFVTPLWVLALIGKSASVDIIDVIVRITQRVMIPLFIGQVAQYKMPTVRKFATKNKKYFKALQENCLTFIVYCAFCAVARDRRRSDGNNQGPVKIIITIVVQVSILLLAMLGAWPLLRLLFTKQPRLRVMGLFGCCQKTVALGVPLIDAIFSDASRSQLGILLLPLLIYHPTQLIVHSAMSSRLAAWVISQETRIGLTSSTDLEMNSSRATDSSSQRFVTESDAADSVSEEEPNQSHDSLVESSENV